LKSQSGNALFLILIAVALFAALSYAVTNSGRGGNGIDRESEAIKLAQINSVISDVQSGVQRLTLRGCKETELDFGNSLWKRNDGTDIMFSGHNGLAPLDGSCSLFDKNGAGLNPTMIPDAGPVGLAANSYLPGSFSIKEAAIDGVGTAKPDLIIVANLVSANICRMYNEENGLDFATLPIETCLAADCGIYFGSYNDTAGISFGDEVPEFIGQHAFCNNWNPSGWHPDGVNYPTSVLIAR